MWTFENFFSTKRPPTEEQLAEKARLDASREAEAALVKKRETPFKWYALRGIKPEAFSLHPMEKLGDIEGVMLSKWVWFIIKEPDYIQPQTFAWDENVLTFSLKKSDTTVQQYSLIVSKELPKKVSVKRLQDGKEIDIVFAETWVTFDISSFQIVPKNKEETPVVSAKLEASLPTVWKKIKKTSLSEPIEKPSWGSVRASILPTPLPKPQNKLVEMFKWLFQ